MPLGDLIDQDGGSVKTGPFGTMLKADEYAAQGGVPVISVGEIGQGELRVGPNTPRVGPQTVGRLPEYVLQAGDIVFARKGAIERTARVKRSEDGFFLGSDGIRLRLADPILARFLAYQLMSAQSQAWLRHHAGGSTMPSLNQSIIGRIPVVVPPLQEQIDIARVLGLLDDLVDTNRRSIAQIRHLGRTTFESLLAECDVQNLGDVAVVNPETTKPKPDGSLTYLDIAGVGDGTLRFVGPISWRDAPGRARRLVDIGDTVWSTVRPNRRAHALILNPPRDLVVSTGLAVLRGTEVGPATLFAAVDRPEFVDHLVRRAEGSAYPAVRPNVFLQVPIPVPTGATRQRFEELMWPQWQWAGELSSECDLLIRTRDQLLPLLMSGRVVPGAVAS